MLGALVCMPALGCARGSSARESEPAATAVPSPDAAAQTAEVSGNASDEAAGEPALIPWGGEGAIVDQAVSSASMIICFMSGEGMIMTGGAADSAFGDTKWGDGTLIAFPNGQTMLIDGGMASYAPLLLKNLEALGIDKLDYVVLSHRHDDHYGGLLCLHGVLESVKVGTVFSTGIYNGESSDPARLEAKALEHGVECVRLHKGDAMEFGGVRMEVLWPEADSFGVSTSTTEDTNNSSLVLRFDYGDVSALFTGDLYKSGEIALITSLDDTTKLDADILKIPHHGRPTSSSRDFVDAVTPKVAVALGAVIMDTAVYSTYVRDGAKVFMDVYDGYVKVTTDGRDLSYECSRSRNVAIYDKIDEAFGKAD